jgi:hypothetical protein
MRLRRSLLVNLRLLSSFIKARVSAGELSIAQGQALEKGHVLLDRAVRANSYAKVLAAVDSLARDYLRFLR